MAAWHSLFLPHPHREAVVQALKDALEALGYTAFNPFGLMPGRTYPQAVRLFVAPEAGSWSRVLGEPDDAMFPLISRQFPCLLVALNGSEARIEAYVDGEQQALDRALSPYLKPGVSLDQLRGALSMTAENVSVQQSDMELLRDALPDDVKSMPVNTREAQKMFDRLSARLTQRSGNAGNEAAARDLLRGERADWNSAGGRRIRAVLECLTIADGWQTPDFVALRDAYQLHERRRRNPAVMLYPGDAEAMAAVTDALNYVAVYAGKG